MYVLKCFPKKVIHSYECVQVGILANNGFDFVFKCHKHGIKNNFSCFVGIL